MPDDVHVEPFLHLVDLTHESALVAWGAFHFVRDQDRERWEIVDDADLEERRERLRGDPDEVLLLLEHRVAAEVLPLDHHVPDFS